jgi:hypothetical protein
MIDFSRVDNKEIKMAALAETVTIDDLRQATNESIDFLISIIEDATDEEIAFIPDDPVAHDPHADTEKLKHIGWSLAHLVLHVTASAEEGATFSSILSRGIVVGGRLRYEPDWQDPKYNTREACIQRLEESRRIRLACLDTWPDEPYLDVYRDMSERFEAATGKLNAPANFLFGLKHEIGHYEQFKETRRQAREAIISKSVKASR